MLVEPVDRSQAYLKEDVEHLDASVEKLRKGKRPQIDDEGGYSPDVIREEQSLIQRIFGLNRSNRYTLKKKVNQSDDEEVVKMISSDSLSDIPGFKYQFTLMLFAPLFYIMFFLPNLIFTVFYEVAHWNYEVYFTACLTYMLFMIVVLCFSNFYNYYTNKSHKAQHQEENLLNKTFDLTQKRSLINQRNLVKIIMLNMISVINLLDTALDVVFFVMVYSSKILWLAILVCLSYIFAFCDRIYNTKRLLSLARLQYKERKVRNIFDQQEHTVAFYSACASLDMYVVGEILLKPNLQMINKLKRILLFNAVISSIQKALFFVFKLLYVYLSSKQSDFVKYGIPMNIMCIIGMFLYVFMKFRELQKYKKIQENGDKSSKQFMNGVNGSCIKFKQTEKGNISKLTKVLLEIESKRKSSIPEEQKLLSTIDKVKVKLLNGDNQALEALHNVLKEQHFLREVSFYKMKFQQINEFEALSDFLSLRRHGIQKLSFKDCQMKEKYLSYLGVNKLSSTEQHMIKDLDLQLRVNEATDFGEIYVHLKSLVTNYKMQVLFQPLYFKKSNRSILRSLSDRSILGSQQQWAQAIALEYQHIKAYYNLIGQTGTQHKGHLLFFKDRNLQHLYDKVMLKQLTKKELDLSNVRDIFTHSFHQERYIELILRGVESSTQIEKLQVRLIQDIAFYDKLNFLQMKISHFTRLIRYLPHNTLTKLHVNLSHVVSLDSYTQDQLFTQLIEAIENHQVSLKELHFTGAQFNYEYKAQKKFYNTMSLVNLSSLVMTNCKFLNVDAFECYWLNLSENDNTLKRVEINRMNCFVSPKGFDEFLISQQESLQVLIMNNVHKNILSKKYMRKHLSLLTQMKALQVLELNKNALTCEKLTALIRYQTIETFQELSILDLSENKLNDDSMAILATLLHHRNFSLDILNLSSNPINDEGLNHLMQVTTNPGQYMLFKELLANNMDRKNYLLNNLNVMQMDRLEVSKSFTTGYDSSLVISGIQNLGVMNNTLQSLDVSYNKISQFQLHHLFEHYLLTGFSMIKSLNLSGITFDETNLDLLQKYLEQTATTLQILKLNECQLRDSFAAKIFMSWLANFALEGEISLANNNLSDQMFQNILDETEVDSARLRDKDPHIIMKVNLSQNVFNDQSIADMLNVLRKYHCQVVHMDLSKNKIGKEGLYLLREYIEENPLLAFETLDVSDNLVSVLKSASIMEMRDQERDNMTKVIYTREVPKVKERKVQ